MSFTGSDVVYGLGRFLPPPPNAGGAHVLDAILALANAAANWLNQNPIRLTVAAGRVAKSDLANALHITTASLRHKIAVLRDSDPDFAQLYREKAKRTELPVDLAEVIVRMLFDGNPHIRVEFIGAEV